MQAKVNTSSHENKSALTRTIRREWNWLSEAMIRRTCRMFRLRLEKAVPADGGYID
jgi:hypothetical protein